MLVNLADFVATQYPQLKHCLVCPQFFRSNALLVDHLKGHSEELDERRARRKALEALERGRREFEKKRSALSLSRKKGKNLSILTSTFVC